MLASCLLFILFFFNHYHLTEESGDQGAVKFKPGPKLNNTNNACVDLDNRCSYWASTGECFVNPAWMMRNCKRSCQACQGEKAWELRKHLLTRYNGSLSNDQQEASKNVAIHMVNVNHMEIEEEEQKMKIHGTLMMAWNDSRVKWDNKKWQISWLNLLWSEIWVPQLASIFALPKRVLTSEFANKAVALHHSGKVFLWVDFMMQSFISFDYGKYPFDEQTACFRFGDLRDFNLQFVVDQAANEALRDHHERLRPAGWTVKTMEVFEEKQQQKMIVIETDDLMEVASSAVDVCVTIKRDTAYVGATYLAPCLATSLITIISMLMPRQCSKVLLIVTSLALQTLFLNTLESKLPPASGKTPLFVKLCSCNIAITCFVLLLELSLCYLEGVKATLPPPRWLIIPASRLSNALPKLVGTDCRDAAAKLHEDDTRMDNIVDLSTPSEAGNLWTPVVRSVRFVAFVSAIAFYFLLFLITFVF